MHRLSLPLPALTALAALVALAGTLLGPTAGAGAVSTPRPTVTANPVDAHDQRALARATAALGRDAGARTTTERPDATLALRDLFLARPTLDGDDDALAGHLLARPTDGSTDPYGDGYSTASTKVCGADVCVHWVRSGADAPPDDVWAAKTLTVMEQVWHHHVDRLGYRTPATDGGRGGNAKFDVYLKELGSQGLYGYCAPEARVAGRPHQASGFCVLDDDFARSQFGRAPIDTLRVTAAHEFFHAIQFAYDFTEDPWLLESTATWMEDRFADDVDDNRSYLPYGQVARPATSLDLFDPNGFAHYGNWPFWEFLSERYGDKIVRQVIQRTGTGGGLPDDYSIEAVRHVLAGRGGLDAVFASYAAANTHPAATYRDGTFFPVARPVDAARLRADGAAAVLTARVDHLASASVRLRPDEALAGKRWRLRLKVDAPNAKTSPAAYLVATRTNGTSFTRRVELNPTGYGMSEVAFSSRRIASVTVTLANASTRYRCARTTPYSCAGTPRDQDLRFRVTARAYRA